MTLAEKILTLRTGQNLSQGELAEKLDVSRQSVSKWETGQSVPELDKLIKLADLFGVSVDQLVRDGGTPEAAAEAPIGETPPAAQPQIVYVERPRRGLTTTQILGVVCTAGGAGLCLISAATANDEVFLIGMVVLIAGLPLLLAKKHPFLLFGWLAWTIGCLFLCTPAIVGPDLGAWQPFTGLAWAWRWLMADGALGGSILLMILLFLLAYGALSALTIILPVATIRLAWKRWKKRKPEGQEQKTV